jgi:hypothetical protein
MKGEVREGERITEQLTSSIIRLTCGNKQLVFHNLRILCPPRLQLTYHFADVLCRREVVTYRVINHHPPRCLDALSFEVGKNLLEFVVKVFLIVSRQLR